MSAGNDESLKCLEAELSKAYELQSQKLGVGKGDQAEGKVLNLIIRCTSDVWEIRADPRHAEMVVKQLGLENSRAAFTPGTKEENKTMVDDSHCQRHQRHSHGQPGHG